MYKYVKNDFVVIVTFDKPRHTIKIFKHGTLMTAPIEYPYQFWTRTKTKGEIANKFIELGIWTKSEAKAELEKFCIELYYALEEFRKKEEELEELPIKKNFTPAEFDRIRMLLTHPKLIQVIKADMDRTIAGEHHNKLLLFMIYCSMFLQNKIHPRMTGESSGGKSFLLNRVADYIPPEHILFKATRVTGKSLEYHLEGKNLNEKLMIIQEFEGGQDAIISLRPLMSADQSEGGLALMTVQKDAVGNIVKREITCQGTPVIAFASTQFYLDDEFETRTWKMEIDESPEQTAAIAQFEAEEEINPEIHKSLIMEDIRNMIRWLRDNGCRNVKNLYAKAIADVIPKEAVRIRRDLKKIFGFISISAWLHQYQRPRIKIDDDEFIVPTMDDLVIAQELYKPSAQLVLVGTNKKLNKVLDAVKEFDEQGAKVTAYDIAKKLGYSQDTCARYLRDLVNKGFLYSDTHPDDRRKRVFWLSESQSSVKKADFIGIPVILSSFTYEYMLNVLKNNIGLSEGMFRHIYPYIFNEDLKTTKEISLEELHRYICNITVRFSDILSEAKDNVLEAKEQLKKRIPIKSGNLEFSKVKEAIIELFQSESFTFDDLVVKFNIKDNKELQEKLKSHLGKLKEQGYIYEPTPDVYFVI